MQNLNVDDVVDSTSDVESNEVVDNVIINENFKRILYKKNNNLEKNLKM